MPESVLADDGLVGLDSHAGDAADHPASAVDLGRVGVDLDAEVVFPGVQTHDDLFDGGVAGPFADAVDAALHLACAEFHGDQAVGHGQAQIVVAVHAERYVLDAGDVGLNVFQQLAEPGGRWDGVAHGVGDVDGGGPGLDHLFQHVEQVLGVGPGGVHGRELYVVAVALGPLHALYGHLQDIFPVLAQLVHLVDLR